MLTIPIWEFFNTDPKSCIIYFTEFEDPFREEPQSLPTNTGNAAKVQGEIYPGQSPTLSPSNRHNIHRRNVSDTSAFKR